MKYNSYMDEQWDFNLKDNIEEFLKKLQDDENFYIFNPVIKGNTKFGKSLGLGFSCYALKCFYMLGLWDSLDKQDRDMWIEYINSFQKDLKGLPINSFIDKEVVNFYTSFTSKFGIKNILKFILNLFNIKKVSTNEKKYIETIRAESKQAIAKAWQTAKRNNKINKQKQTAKANKQTPKKQK